MFGLVSKQSWSLWNFASLLILPTSRLRCINFLLRRDRSRTRCPSGRRLQMTKLSASNGQSERGQREVRAPRFQGVSNFDLSVPCPVGRHKIQPNEPMRLAWHTIECPLNATFAESRCFRRRNTFFVACIRRFSFGALKRRRNCFERLAGCLDSNEMLAHCAGQHEQSSY